MTPFPTRTTLATSLPRLVHGSAANHLFGAALKFLGKWRIAHKTNVNSDNI